MAANAQHGVIDLPVKDKARKLTERILKNIERVNEDSFERLIKLILSTVGTKKIFIVGAGRSGLVGRSLANRLMHVGFNVYVVGETVTPALKRGDLLIAISGSGETKYPVSIAEEAKKLGAIVVAITSYPDSTLGKIADHKVIVGGRTQPAEDRDYILRQLMGQHEPLTPMGTLFELSTSVLCDALIAELTERMGKTEEDLRSRHASIE